MWKPLDSMQTVYPGDVIRYVNPPQSIKETLYQVVKADQHYFEVIPAVQSVSTRVLANKVVRYFDIGYYLRLEVWNEQ
jgi:hypothetical protein